MVHVKSYVKNVLLKFEEHFNLFLLKLLDNLLKNVNLTGGHLDAITVDQRHLHTFIGIAKDVFYDNCIELTFDDAR
jgi:hypothetical protein